jgi:hypothetical protein
VVEFPPQSVPPYRLNYLALNVVTAAQRRAPTGTASHTAPSDVRLYTIQWSEGLKYARSRARLGAWTGEAILARVISSLGDVTVSEMASRYLYTRTHASGRMISRPPMYDCSALGTRTEPSSCW